MAILGTSGRGAARILALAALGLGVIAGSAPAQELTQAQKDAMRSNCRSDYMANCMSVSPGGREALECMNQNMAKLSPGCQAAVKAAMPPPAAAKPAESPPGAATPATPATPPPAAATAPAAAPPPAAAKPVVKRPAAPAPARAATPAPVAPPATAPPPAAPEPTIAVSQAKINSLSLIARAEIVRSCGADQQAVCPDVRAGGGRIIACLAAHAPALSPRCRQTLTQALR